MSSHNVLLYMPFLPSPIAFMQCTILQYSFEQTHHFYENKSWNQELVMRMQ